MSSTKSKSRAIVQSICKIQLLKHILEDIKWAYTIQIYYDKKTAIDITHN